MGNSGKKEVARKLILVLVLCAISVLLVMPAAAAKGKRAKKASPYKSLGRLQSGLKSVIKAKKIAVKKLTDLRGEDDATEEEQLELKAKIRKCKLDEKHIRAEIEVVKSLNVFTPPVPGRITSGFGNRLHPILHVHKPHNGIDLSGAVGDPVRASWPGTVIVAGYQKGYGNAVIIEHSNSKTTVYGHLSKISAQVGEEVRAGSKIGEVGKSGLATGPHLHFEVRLDGEPIDPRRYW